MSKNRLKLSVLYLVSYFSFAFPGAFIPTFLEKVGYDVFLRGLMFSGGALVAIVGQFLIGFLCDRFKQVKVFYQAATVVFVLSAMFLFQITQQLFFMHMIFTSLVLGMFRVTTAVQDSWSLETDEDSRLRFGFIRAFGAIGWMIGTPIAAMLIKQYGYGIISYAFLVLSLVSIGLSIGMKDAHKVTDGTNVHISEIKQLFHSKPYVLILITFLFINMIATADTYTTVDKMIALGGTEAIVASRWSLQAFVELPLFFIGGYLIKRFGDWKLMMFGTFVYMIRFALYAWVQTPEAIVLVAILQGLTFPLIMITSKTLVDDVTPPRLRSSGQTVALSIYVGIPMLITPILSGFFIRTFGVDMTLLFFAAIAILPLTTGIMFLKSKQALERELND